jgi:hypothetical protein
MFKRNILFTTNINLKPIITQSFTNKNTLKNNFFLNKIHIIKNFSNIYNTDKDKKLSQFFKLPSLQNLKDDQIFDKSEESDISVADTYDHEIDKIDLMNKIIKKKLFEEERKINKFFNGNSDRENIKITEKLVESMRLKKEFRFSEEFKRKEILNEYGNYDKYFDNYKIIREKEPDLEDDGENKWNLKYKELQEKYNNPNSKLDNERIKRKQLNKMIEDLNNYGYEFTFQDYLNFKENFDEPDFHSTNPRDLNEDYIEKVDSKLFVDINDKQIDRDAYIQDVFGKTPIDEDEEEKDRVFEDAQDFDDNIPMFLKDKKPLEPEMVGKGKYKLTDDTPFEDRFGRELAPVNLETEPDETPLEYQVREEFKGGRNLRNKMAELRKDNMEAQQLMDELLEEENKIEEKKNKDNRAR